VSTTQPQGTSDIPRQNSDVLAAPAPRRSRRLVAERTVLGVVGLLIGFAIWERLGMTSNPAVFAPFTDTVIQVYRQFLTGGPLLSAVLDSMRIFLFGMGFSITIGLTLGILLARVRLIALGLEDFLTAIYVTPTVALIPFILSLWGFGFGPKVLVVVLIATFPILFNTVEGARSIPKELLDVASSFRSKERHIWIHVLLPYTFAFFLTGLRQSVARGLVGTVAAEFFLSSSGVGQYIIIASRRFDTPSLLAAVLVLMLLAVFVMVAAQRLENAFAAWK
jgi:ABC-type nitrate/sulfonate/bicarbonate transport system permease component